MHDDIGYVSKEERENQLLKTRLESAERKNEAMIGFVKSFGFTYIPYGGNWQRFSHYKSIHCLCGDQRYPVIEPYIYEPGKWIAHCPHCDARSIESKDPVDAVRNWNRRNLTEASQITSQKLTKDNLDTDGALALLQAIKQNAVDDLAAAEKMGKFDTPAVKQAEWFIKNKKIIAYVKSGEYRKRMEEERKKQYENLHRESPCDECPEKPGGCPETDQSDPRETPDSYPGCPAK